MPTEYTEIAFAVGSIHLLPFLLGVYIYRKPKTPTGEADIAGPMSTYLPNWAICLPSHVYIQRLFTTRKRSQTEVSKPLNVVSLTPPVDIELMIGVQPRQISHIQMKWRVGSSIKLGS
ncbi:uncharacterized protein An07g03870 [Aspergillus niger]|uniref:Contig An07c0100, genomic contig n=2 Tax=Aspergillus niger TaxID=5061 RepID=A2QMZ6_ASPNC|nr:uncharacterized protein An07g03870 [Aspergillus niger]CAK48137.1 unnamed protein product [Aspergillus niger]